MVLEPYQIILIVLGAVVIFGALYLMANRPPPRAEVAPPATVATLREQESAEAQILRNTRREIDRQIAQTDAENRRIRFGNAMPQIVMGLIVVVAIVVVVALFMPRSSPVLPDNQLAAAVVVQKPLTKDDLRQVITQEVPPIVNREIDKRLPLVQPAPVAPIVHADLPPSISEAQGSINRAVQDDIGTLKSSTADINSRLSANTTQLSNIDAKLDSVLARPPKVIRQTIRKTLRKKEVQPLQTIIIQPQPQPQDNDGLLGISSPLFSFRLGPQRQRPPQEPPPDYYGPVQRCPYFHGAHYYQRC
jgi:hypothetical protein